MPDNLIPVNILIADRNYRLKIQPEDEEVVRRTMKVINEKIIEYKTNFSGKDMQDYVSMVLLWFATEQQKPMQSAASKVDSSEKLQKVEDLLDRAIQKINWAK